jgi:hypothetical protein
MTDSRRYLRAAFTSLLAVTASCFSWEAPSYDGGSISFGSDVSGLRTAFATWQIVDQHGSGGAYVDGRNRILSAGVLVWECDANSRQLHAFGSLPYIVNNYGGDSVVVTSWQSDSFVLYAPLGATSEMRVTIEGAFATTAPTDTVVASQVISPYCSGQLDSLRALPRSRLK